MNSRKIQNLFGPHPSHLLALLSLPASSRFRIWISGSQTLQCPLTPRLSRPPLSPSPSLFPSSLQFIYSLSLNSHLSLIYVIHWFLPWVLPLLPLDLDQFHIFHTSPFRHNFLSFTGHITLSSLILQPSSVPLPPACVYVCLCAQYVCIFLTICQWFSSSAFVLLAGCRVGLEVKVDVVVVVIVVLVVVTSEWRLSEVPWNLAWSQLLLFLLSPHVSSDCFLHDHMWGRVHLCFCLTFWVSQLHTEKQNIFQNSPKILRSTVELKVPYGIFGH